MISVTAANAAGDRPRSSQPVNPRTLEAIHCTLGNMTAAVETDYVPTGVLKTADAWYSKDIDPSEEPQPRRHAMPGPGGLQFHGLLTAGGGACVQHLGRATGEDSVPAGLNAAAQLYGIDPSLLTKQRGERVKKELDAAKGKNLSDADKRALVRKAGPIHGKKMSGSKLNTVIAVFSPNLYTAETGALPGYFTVRSVGGWTHRGAGYVIINLLGVDPADLRPGKTYDAVAATAEGGDKRIVRTLPAFYSDSVGTYTKFTRPPEPPTNSSDPSAAAQAAMEAGVRQQTCGMFAQMQQSDLQGLGDAIVHMCQHPNEEVAFQGKRHLLTGLLKGKVHIVRITRKAVIGSFELHGNLKLETTACKYLYDGNGQLTGEDCHKADKHGRFTVNGGFSAPNVRGYESAKIIMPLVLGAVSAHYGGR
jgi:hypothetical protein